MQNESTFNKSSEVLKDCNVTIASPQDAKGIAEVQKEGWLTTYVNSDYGVTEEDILSKDFDGDARVSRWAESIAAQDTKTWVAKEGDKIIGFCLVKNGEDTNHIGALYVLSSARGSGVGSKLMDQALDYLGSEKPIELEVATYNHKAIAFYEKFGFKNMGAIEEPTSDDFPSGAQIPELKMILNKKA